MWESKVSSLVFVFRRCSSSGSVTISWGIRCQAHCLGDLYCDNVLGMTLPRLDVLCRFSVDFLVAVVCGRGKFRDAASAYDLGASLPFPIHIKGFLFSCFCLKSSSYLTSQASFRFSQRLCKMFSFCVHSSFQICSIF